MTDQPTTSAWKIRSGPFLLLILGLISLYSLANERLSFRFCDNDYDKNIYSTNQSSTMLSQLPPEKAQLSSHTRKSLKDDTKINRKVHFLHPSDFNTFGEYYSGMWWQRLDNFINTSYDEMGVPEDASFKSYIFHHYRDIRLTRDWVDFSVEHLSQYVKRLMVDPAQDAVTDQLTAILTNYIRRAEPYDLSEYPDSAAHSTIAVLPLRVTSSNKKANDLLALELAATIVSLWKVGIPRAIVVGVSEYEEVIANQSFSFVQEKMPSSLGHTMALQSIEYTGVSLESKRLVAKVALLGLQTAFQQHEQQIEPEHVHAWLGSNPNRWKYVYFSEPDLVLHTRYDAVSAISRTLKKGNLMAAHRLEAVPHQRDFPMVDPQTLVDRVLPNHGVFGVVHNIDSDESSCCDQGRYYPANRANPQVLEEVRFNAGCKSNWVHCGFLRKSPDVDYHNPATILETHHRLVGYPLFTLQDGTGVPLVGSHQRMCLPQKRGVCD